MARNSSGLMRISVPPTVLSAATRPTSTRTGWLAALRSSSTSPVCTPWRPAAVLPMTTWFAARIAASWRPMMLPTASVDTALVDIPKR